MTLADSVDNFSSSLPTHMDQENNTPHTFPPNPSAGMVDQEPVHLMKDLLESTIQMQQKMYSLLDALSGAITPAQPAPANEPVPVEYPTPAPSTPMVKLKIAHPIIFNGDPTKSEDFLNSLDLYFYGHLGASDAQKITCALSYMKEGTAAQWSKRTIRHYHQEETFPSWKDFVLDFKQTFADPDPQGTACHKLRMLRQGNGSCEEYIAAFKEVMLDTGYNDVALKQQFERGLSRSLIKMMYGMREMPKDLKGWMEHTRIFDSQQRIMEESLKFSSSYYTNQPKPHHPPAPTAPTAPKPTPPAARPPSNSDVVPMEIDASRKRFTPGVCFKCKKTGHYQRDCKATYNINAMDFDSLRAHFRKLEEEETLAKTKEGGKDTQAQDFQ
jgi:hypothetical protein